jgi:hypothetical protein
MDPRIDNLGIIPFAFKNDSIQANNFLKNLESADTAFKTKDAIPADKLSFSKELEESFVALHQIYKVDKSFFEHFDNLSKISRLFYLLGRLKYGGEMENARRCFQSALLLKLASWGMLKPHFLAILMDNATFEQFLKSSSEMESPVKDLPEKILSNVSKSDILRDGKDPDLFELSCNLRWLGHACQNINALSTADGLGRFKTIYGWAKEINKKLIDFSTDFNVIKNASWEHAELLYNTTRFMLDLEAPQEKKGTKELILLKIESLNELNPYLEIEGDTLRAKQKKVQIENIRTIEKGKLKDPLLNEDCIKQSFLALQRAEEIQNFDSFLLNMFRCNYVGFSLDANCSNYDELNVIMKKAIDFVKENSHYYFASYYVVAAKLAVAQKDIDQALKYLIEAETLAKKSLENSAPLLKSIVDLRGSIKDSTKSE